jgi:hypothetical protein
MKIRIFVSYAHADSKYVDENNSHSILKFIKGLEQELNVEFWHDKGKISTGDLWDQSIRQNIGKSHMAICLVSQNFVDSLYITKVEISSFINKRTKDGMIIYPIILSDCEWGECEWLKQTQHIPVDGKNIERHFNAPGKRKELYTRIRKELKNIIARVQGDNKNISQVAPTNRPIVNTNEDVALANVANYMDAGDYISAKNMLLGGLKFEDMPFHLQVNIVIIEQKHGLIADALKHLNVIYGSALANVADSQVALLDLVRLKVRSQAHDFGEVIKTYQQVAQSLISSKQTRRLASVFNRAGMAYAVLRDTTASRECLQKGLMLARKHNESHFEATSLMYQSIAKYFAGIMCEIQDPLRQIVECQYMYFKHPIDKSNVILWQTYNCKSIVQCLFAEAAMYLARREIERGYIRLTIANLLAPIAKSNPNAEGYAELLSIINQPGIKKLVNMAMYSDESHKDSYQNKITSISVCLKQVKYIVPLLCHNFTLHNWKMLRAFLIKYDENYA